MAVRIIKPTPGYNSLNEATFVVNEHVYQSERSLSFDVNELAAYVLRYLPDTNEVVLIKGDEILYSEVVS